MVSDKTLLSDRSKRVLEALGDDFLVEVFHPRDFYGRKWADSDTFQFRFEEEDLLVGRSPDERYSDRQWEALTGFEGVHQGSTVGLVGNHVCWLMNQSLDKETGTFGRMLDLTKDTLRQVDDQNAK